VAQLWRWHHITRPVTISPCWNACITRAQQDWGVTVYLEPGEACALNAGFLLSRVLDVVLNGDITIAILDASAACHMPDVIEMPYARRCLPQPNREKSPAPCALPGRPAWPGMSSGITAWTPFPTWEICWCSAIWHVSALLA